MPLEYLPLRFEYADLAPAMTASAARWHREVVHAGYHTAINDALKDYPELANRTIEQLLTDLEALPLPVRDAVRDVGGGHANHQFLWKIIGGARNTRPSPALDGALVAAFGGFEPFKTRFRQTAMALEGDGWIFLTIAAPRSRQVEIVVTRNNGSVLTLRKPGILICDLWDHAYRDEHGGDRGAWLDAFLDVVDWTQCSMRYELLLEGKPLP